MKKILFIAALIGLIVMISKKAKSDRDQWQGMTEDEVRSRLDERLPNRVPEERREAIADTIVGKMRDRGVLADEDSGETIELTDDGQATAEEETAPTSA